jgi:hypothetical protein
VAKYAGVEFAKIRPANGSKILLLANTKQDILTQVHVDNMVQRSGVHVYPLEK